MTTPGRQREHARALLEATGPQARDLPVPTRVAQVTGPWDVSAVRAVLRDMPPVLLCMVVSTSVVYS